MPTHYNRRWTPEEEQYIRDHWQTQTEAEMAAALDRLEGAVRNKRRALRCSTHPTWTAEEIEYLEEKWGTVSIPSIAKKLGRTTYSVRCKATKMGLGSVLMGGDYVTLNQLIVAVTGSTKSYSYKLKSWVKERGLPVHTKRVNKCTWKVVYLEEFWEWAKENRSFLDFSKMELLALGAEPDWMAQQRRIEAVAYATQRKDPWTPQEDERLTFLLKQHKYSWAELSREMRRSVGAIQHRCQDLNLKDRPLRESPHNPWSDEDLQTMAEMIRQGCSWAMIGEACGGRSEKAVRGVAFNKYHTEVLDKVRVMLGDGPWGHGAPEPTVKSEKHKEIVKKPIRRLCELLLMQRNALGWDDYWQRDMCQHWDSIHGCLMKSPNCDDCTKFQRIQPQYCRLCVREFLDRKPQDLCPKCRAMKKKSAQKKYAVLHARGRR